jgi:hypothetical protein
MMSPDVAQLIAAERMAQGRRFAEAARQSRIARLRRKAARLCP